MFTAMAAIFVAMLFAQLASSLAQAYETGTLFIQSTFLMKAGETDTLIEIVTLVLPPWVGLCGICIGCTCCGLLLNPGYTYGRRLTSFQVWCFAGSKGFGKHFDDVCYSYDEHNELIFDMSDDNLDDVIETAKIRNNKEPNTAVTTYESDKKGYDENNELICDMSGDALEIPILPNDDGIFKVTPSFFHRLPRTTTLRPTKDRQANDEHQKQGSTYPNQQTWTQGSTNSKVTWKDRQSRITRRPSLWKSKITTKSRQQSAPHCLRCDKKTMHASRE